MSAFAPGLESWIVSYLVNSLWQVPLVFVAALAAARLARPAGPRMEHRIWVSALLLEVTLPLCHFQIGPLIQQAWSLASWLRSGSPGEGHAQVIVGAGTAAGIALPWLTPAALLVITASYACCVLYFAVRLAWGVWTTEHLRRLSASFHPDEETVRSLTRFRRLLGMAADQVELAHAQAISGPATVGFRRHTLLLPPAFLERLSPDDRDAVLAHELAHMARRDFAKNLAYGIIALPVAYHPLLLLTRARLAETRELLCDAMAAEAVGGRESYAKSLLRMARMLSDAQAPRILHAIGILDANIFERRVMNLTRRSPQLSGKRRFMLTAACALVAIATCTSALALRMEVKTPTREDAAPAKLKVKVVDLTIVNKVTPVYPPDAKRDRVSGAVVLSATIGKDGTVGNVKVVQSVRDDVDSSAMDAVRQWTYKPYLLNGDPVEVDTTITVVYTLAE